MTAGNAEAQRPTHRRYEPAECRGRGLREIGPGLEAAQKRCAEDADSASARSTAGAPRKEDALSVCRPSSGQVVCWIDRPGMVGRCWTCRAT